MDRIDKQIKQVVDQLGTDIDPQHVRNFHAFLLSKKRERRRRMAAIILTGGLGLLLLGWVVSTQLSIPGKADTALVVEEQVDKNTGLRSSEIIKESLQETLDKDLVISNVSNVRNVGNKSDPSNLGNEIVAEINRETGKNMPARAANISGVSNTTAVHSEPDNGSIFDGNEETREILSFRSLNSLPFDRFEENSAATLPIKPVIASKAHYTWEYGIHSSWFPLSRHFGQSNLENGMGFSIGLNLKRALSRRVLIHLDGGFTMFDKGFGFQKESLREEYGFGYRSQSNMLMAEQAYMWHAGAAIGLRHRRHTISVGARAHYLYGLKGDIVRPSAEDPGITQELSNVWLATSGLNQFPVDGLVDYGFAVNHKVQLNVGLRVPIVQLVSKDRVDTDYGYNVQRYGITPQIGLYYKLSR